jgi:hypothetical protein
MNTPAQPIQMIEATLQDGTKVQVTELGIGGIVTIDGVPAPVGEHTLEDGTVIVLGENGTIMEIKPKAETEIEIEVPADMTAKFSAFESATNEKFSSYESKFAAYESRFAEYESKLNKANQVIDGLLNLTKTLAEAPTGAADPVVKGASSFSEQKQKSYDILFS